MNQPREVQFVIERECQAAAANAPEPLPQSLKDSMPFPIWVYWPPPEIRTYRACDAAVIYRVTEHSVEQARRDHGRIRPGTDHHVCEHMGHIIE